MIFRHLYELVQNRFEGNNKCGILDISNKAKLSDYSTKKSYASATKSSGIYETNKLMFIPTEMNELGGEVVVFDEELVAIGTKKWELTLCGHLVGHYMSVPALRYHLRRMWNRYGLKEIVDNGNGNWLFKFSSEQGMNLVAEQSPWMVNSKPLMVYKWDPNVGMNKVEPKKLPIWVKLAEIPLEAWTVEGISAIGSSVGKPIIMDSMTAYVCKNGVGRNEYARVLVEIDALKGFKETIELQYRDKDKNVKGTKTVKVTYEWKPPLCPHCKVFGHDFKECKIRARTEEEIATERAEVDKTMNDAKESEFVPTTKNKQQDEFIPAQNRRRNVQQQNRNWQYRNNYNNNSQRQEYRKKIGVNDKGKGIAQVTASTSIASGSGKSMTNAENSNRYEILNGSYDDEFPAFPISQNQS